MFTVIDPFDELYH